VNKTGRGQVVDLARFKAVTQTIGNCMPLYTGQGGVYGHTYCELRPALKVETELNKVQVGCSRIFNVRDQYEDEHNNARDMTVPVLGHQSGVPIRVCGVVPEMSLTPGRVWRGAPSIGQDTSDIPSRLLNLDDTDIASLYEHKAVHRTELFLTPQVDAVHP
jgi:crotonobetainyl-CoA:carnitine CoA-transferase CaiB-like acyl-CoA transferase